MTKNLNKMMTLPVASAPVAIGAGIAAALNAHALSLTPDILAEITESATRALLELDESLVVDAEPSMADRLAVGETLRSLAMMGRPNQETARALARVGEWLTKNAKAELAKGVGAE